MWQIERISIGNSLSYVKDKVNADPIVDGVLISHGIFGCTLWAFRRHKSCYVLQQSFAHALYWSSVPWCCSTIYFIGNAYCWLQYMWQWISWWTSKWEVLHYTIVWTDEGFTPTNSCGTCFRSRMPWFCKSLPLPTTDFNELHICYNQPASKEKPNISNSTLSS